MSLKFRYEPKVEKTYTTTEHFEVVKKGSHPWGTYIGFGVLDGQIIVGVSEGGTKYTEWRATKFTYQELKEAMEEYERLQKEHKQ